MLRNDTLHWYLATTDGGSNEIGARRIIQADMFDLPNAVFSETTCLEHSQHLVALSTLKAADKALKGFRTWGYYSSLATCANVLRDICKLLFCAWGQMFGAMSAKKEVKTLFPKAIAGRWNGCYKPEEKLLQLGQDRLEPLVKNILEEKIRKDKGSKSKKESEINEMAVEEQQAYAAKMGRWRRRTLECLRDHLWWRCIKVMHSCRQPLSHLSYFLHKVQRGHWGRIAQLCDGKNDAIQSEFHDVWPQLQESSYCLLGDDLESQFLRNFANLRLRFIHFKNTIFPHKRFTVLSTPSPSHQPQEPYLNWPEMPIQIHNAVVRSTSTHCSY